MARITEICERERLPRELDVDGELILSVQGLPAGLWGDGPASVYRRFDIPPGQYQLSARLRDTERAEGRDYTYTQSVNLVAGRYLPITFKPETGGFKIR